MTTQTNITRIGNTLTTYPIVKWRFHPITKDLILINAIGQKFTIEAHAIPTPTTAQEETPLTPAPRRRAPNRKPLRKE